MSYPPASYRGALNDSGVHGRAVRRGRLRLGITALALSAATAALIPGQAGAAEPPRMPMAPAMTIGPHGDIYMADAAANSVTKVPAGTIRHEPLPFNGLNHPSSVAVDGVGDVFVADTGNNRVLMLAPGAASPQLLPFGDLDRPDRVAFDQQGTLLVTDAAGTRGWRPTLAAPTTPAPSAPAAPAATPPAVSTPQAAPRVDHNEESTDRVQRNCIGFIVIC